MTDHFNLVQTVLQLVLAAQAAAQLQQMKQMIFGTFMF
jgi:hypothetical protein